MVQAGFVSNGSFGFPDQVVRARGVYGEAIESGVTQTDSVGRFSVTMLDLSPPFLFEAAGWVAVAAGPVPNVNITPFTAMQSAVLTGTDPLQFFENLAQGGEAGNTVVRRMTPAAIEAAQNTVLEVMREDAGFTFEHDTLDFVRHPFKIGPGDPMAESITLFMNNFGDPSPFYPLLINEGKKCRTERVFTVVEGLIRTFCPALKSNLPDEPDPGITVYGFTSSRSDSLQVRARNGTVVGVKFTRHDEELPYACAGLECAGVTLGAIREDDTRTITFDSTRVTREGSATHAALAGDLLAPDAGPPRPPEIECAEGLIRMTLQFEDGSLRQGCTTGAFGNYVYEGITSSQFDAFDDDGNGFSLVVRSRGAEVLSVATQDPNTGALFYCRGSDCSGIAATEPDGGGAFTVSINGLSLPSVNQDGTPTGAGPAIVTANGPLPAFAAEPTGGCIADAYDTLSVSIAGSSPTILCIGSVPGEFRGTFAFDPGAGDTSYVARCLTGCDVSIIARDGIVSMFFLSLAFGDNYATLDPAFGGISVSGPDADGFYTVVYDNVPIVELEAFNIPGGRTGILDGTVDSIAMISLGQARATQSRLDRQARTAFDKSKARVALKPGAVRTKKPKGRK